jgi:hypothetical protein
VRSEEGTALAQENDKLVDAYVHGAQDAAKRSSIQRTVKWDRDRRVVVSN